MTDNSKMVAELGSSRPMQVRSSFRRSAQGREIVIVLGMHRSGTSLLANVLHLLGVDMVDEPPHASPSNEKGFWERPDIRAIHDDILNVLGVPVGSTAHAVPFAAGWWRSVEIKKLKEQLRDLLAAHLAQVRRPWGFKDPRTCRLLPLWGEILEELDVSPRFVWAVRHPAECSISMTMKNPVHRPIPVAQSEVMWLAYNYDILRHAGRHWPIIVPFDQWFEDPLSQAKELARELDLVWQGSDHELQSALVHLVSGESRHHQVSNGKLRCNLAISEEIYRSILAIGSGEASEASEAAAVSLHSLLMAVQPFALAAKDAKTLKDENHRLAKNIEQLRTDAAERDRLQLCLAEATAEREGLRAQLASAKAAEEALREARVAAARKMDAFRSHLATANAAKEQAEAKLAATAAEMELLHTEQKATAARAEALQDENQKLAGEVEQLRGDAAERDRLQLSLAQITPERDALMEQLAAAKAAEEALREERVAAARKMDAFRSHLATANAAKEQAEAKLAAAIAEGDALKAKGTATQAALEGELAAAVAEVQLLKVELAASTEARAALEREAAASKEQDGRLAGEIARLNEEAAVLRGKLRAERERHAEAFQTLLLKTMPARQAEGTTSTMDS